MKIKFFRPDRPSWTAVIVLLCSALTGPLIYIVTSSLLQTNDNWQHLLGLLLPRYLSQTLLLAAGVTAGTGILGVWSAWIITHYDFRGKKALEACSYLPLAVPAYILAFVYANFFSISGPVSTTLQRVTGLTPAQLPAMDIMNMAGLIMVMTLALFPYVFTAARASFSIQSSSLLEAAGSLGVSRRRAFWTIAFPLARPAIAAGISLVLMETLSEYGAVHYYGVENFTTGIFRAWFTLRDTALALKLAGILLLFTFGFIAVERKSRGKQNKYASSLPKRETDQGRKLKGIQYAVSMAVVTLPVLLGFVLPVIMLVIWGLPTAAVIPADLGRHLLQTLGIGIVSSGAAVITALILVHGKTVLGNSPATRFISFSTMGYGIPGAVLALAVLITGNSLLHGLRSSGIISLASARSLLLFTGFMSLIAAFVIRYLAVAYTPLSAHYQRIGRTLVEASTGLGISPIRTLLSVNIPLLKTPLLIGSLLVFIDLIKELPITLILRPFNVETLATKAYYYASNEMLSRAAPYSLMIVVLGLIPTLGIVVLKERIRKR